MREALKAIRASHTCTATCSAAGLGAAVGAKVPIAPAPPVTLGGGHNSAATHCSYVAMRARRYEPRAWLERRSGGSPAGRSRRLTTAATRLIAGTRRLHQTHGEDDEQAAQDGGDAYRRSISISLTAVDMAQNTALANWTHLTSGVNT